MNVICRVSHQKRSALTLIEVVVVITVVGLLAALLIPAVVAARAAAARVRCLNNLRQFGLATSAYVASCGALPPACGLRTASLHVSLLPYMEMNDLFNSVNIETNSMFTSIANITAASATPNVFFCPSDSRSGQHSNGQTSYAGNSGDGQLRGIFGFSSRGMSKLAECTDGTSQTAAMSEWLLGAGNDTDRNPQRVVFQTSNPFDTEQFAVACRTIDSSNAKFAGLPSKGLNWMHGDLGWTFYNHTLGPNLPSCTNAGGHQNGAWTATSAHPGGVNLLFLDGHCRFIRDEVDISVWRALASRDGGEVVNQGDL